ncbi:MAG: cysteine--tRNA ligase [Deltaproteobacteria bacterium]|nr:cysteine--tRNA ligase [Deltaproteobacteria bacterium]
MTSPEDSAPAIQLFDTLTARKVPFEPLVPGRVSLYVCGVTVYDFSHIGHARVYVFFDTMVRFLESVGYEVRYARNFTDVDDKIIKRANELGLPANAVSEKFIGEFKADMAALGVRAPTFEPKVTEHITEIIALTKTLVDRGAAYTAGGDVFFEVEKFPGYAKLSKRDLKEMQVGARVDVNEAKRSPLDFVLWKAAKPGEPSWESPWGAGRPGWHIECSAMSMKYLGETFDIHGGGSDLIFPHHENEIAQSEAATGGGSSKPFARHWCHMGFVTIDAEKMSKSLGNFFTVRDVRKEYHPEGVRYFLLTTHYRSPINYATQSLDEAARRVAYGYTTLARMNTVLGVASASISAVASAEFIDAMRDDFNTAAALGVLAGELREANELLDKRAAGWKEKLASLRANLLGAARILGVFEAEPESFLASWRARHLASIGMAEADVERLIAERQAARKGKDFSRADAIRAELVAKRILLQDEPGRTTWRVDA